MQAEQHIEKLPQSPLEASAAYFAEHLEAAREMIEDNADALVIVLPQAGSDHDDWRRSLARDLARLYAPKRVNVVGGKKEAIAETLAYLSDAPGVTGQYCPLHG